MSEKRKSHGIDKCKQYKNGGISMKAKQLFARHSERRGGKQKRVHYRNMLMAALFVVGETSVLAAPQVHTPSMIASQNQMNVVGQSTQKQEIGQQANGMKISLQEVVAKENELNLKLVLEKTDGVPFQGNLAKLGGYIKLEGDGQKAQYDFVGLQRNLVQSECTGTKEVYNITIKNFEEKNEVGYIDENGKFVLEDLGKVSSFKNKKATLVITNITEEYTGKDYPDINLNQYIDAKAEEESMPYSNAYKLGQHTVDKNGKQVINEPTKMLAYKKLNQPLYNKKERIKLDNIGFIDGKLHIRLYGDIRNGEDLKTLIATVNEGYNLSTTQKVAMMKASNDGEYQKTGHLEQYYIFDIKDTETLKKNPILASITKVYKENEVAIGLLFETK